MQALFRFGLGGDECQPLDLMVLARLNDAFDESNLVFKVDISDWASLSNEFRHDIKGDLILI